MERFRTEDGIGLAYRDGDDRSGLPLLALAGLTRDRRDFDYLARRLPAGIRLIRLDSRGRGASDWAPPETYNVAQEARDAVALLDHLGIEKAQERAKLLVDQAIGHLDIFGEKATHLRSIATFVLERRT